MATVTTAIDLRTALVATSKIVFTRCTNPILSGVLLHEGALTASDGEVMATLDVATPQSLSVVVPHSRLLAIANACSSPLKLSASGESCVIKGGGGKWTLPSQSREEYPTWADECDATICKLPVDQFLRAVTSVIQSADQHAQSATAGVLLEVIEDGVFFVATDGHRMAIAKCEHDLSVDDSSTLIPAHAAATLARIASICPQESLVQIDKSSSVVSFVFEGARVLVRPLTGSFPKWQSVVPQTTEKRAIIERRELLSAVNAASVVVSETSRGVRFVGDGQSVEVCGKSSEYGQSKVAVPVIDAGEAMTFVVNPRYVAQWLSSLPNDADPTVQVSCGRSVLLECGDEYQGIVMPLEAE